MKTTIQISREVKEMLDEFKLHPREPYDSVIRRLIEEKVDDEPLAEETLRKIEESLKDLKAGRIYTTEEVKRELEV
ncbi:MAG TPA: hypothetical protein ENG27_01005 [Candidatus Bathyarchaeota archaeon]|nr:hypothetical protein [Candidatus Bathyarchaeota archaeon]